MRKFYTSYTFNWMLTTLMYLVSFFMSTETQAANVHDYGLLELNKSYDIPADYGKIMGYYTAEKDAVIKLTATSSDYPEPFSDADYTTKIDYTITLNGGIKSYDISLKAGETVYFYRRFCMNEGTFTLTSVDELNLSSINPEEGSSFFYGGDPSVTFKFSAAVLIGSAQIVIGDYTQDIEAYVSGSTVHITPKNYIKELVESGKLQKGDTFSFRLTNVRMTSDESKVYGEDGTCEVSYVCAGKAIELVSVSGLLDSDNKTFLSYWPQGDSRGILRMTFSGDLLQPEENSSKYFVTLGYGNAEGAEGEYYYEAVPYTVDGSTLICDFTGKLRTPDIMVTSGTDYGSMKVKVLNVTDADGNLSYAENSGALGSYTYILSYEEVKADLTTQFTPASGENLESDEIELWTTDYDKLSFDGILFTYEVNGETKSVVSTDYTVTEDTDVDGAAIITIRVPAEVQSKQNITVTLNNLVVYDGLDHSSDFTAKYNAFVVKKATYQEPTDGAVAISIIDAEIANFEAGGKLTISTNRDNQIGYATYQVVDLNAEDENNAIIMTLASLRHPNGSDGQPDLTQPLEAEIYGGTTKFYRSHTYRLDITAYSTENDYTYHNDPIGIDSVKFKGTSEHFVFSSIQFESADPENYSTISTNKDAVITLTWDGMVTLDSSTSFINYGMGTTLPITKIEAINEDDGFSNKWQLTISQATLEQLEGSLLLSIVAKDDTGALVEGNEGTEENSYLALEYTLTSDSEEASIAISPADGKELSILYQFTVSSLNGEGISKNESLTDNAVKLYSATDKTEVAQVTSVELVIPEGKENDFSYTPTAITLTLNKKITEKGSYYLEIPASYFILGEQFDTKYNAALTANYTVDGLDAINEATNSESDKTDTKNVYTLKGIRLTQSANQLSKGIYIVNGKKLIVK